MMSWSRCIRLILMAMPVVTGLMVGERVRAEGAAPAPACASSVTPSSASFAKLVSADNDFGFRLLGSLRAGSSGNVFISPTSVALALGMAYDGARGSTQSAMASALQLQGMSPAATRQEAAALMGRLQTSSGESGLSVANSLWARAGTPFRSAFLQHARHDYDATVRTLDFNAPGAPGAINSWVSCATQGKIPTIVDRIPPEMVLYLINAVYFHGAWAQPFQVSNTHQRPFTTAAGRQVQVPLMARAGTLPYYQGPDFQAVALPYAQGRFSMVVVLPRRGTSLQRFGGKVTAASWRRWTSQLKPMAGSLSLPRFSLTNDFLLNRSLGQLGMARAFGTGADYSGMCVRRCRISEVRHKTYLSVDEKGTTAAAATSVGVATTAIPAQQFTMVVDHPFFLSIQDSVTGAVLFAGVVTNPK